MLKNIFSLTGVKALSKTEQQPINGGAQQEASLSAGDNLSRCRFPDGTGWTLNFDERWQANAADASCEAQGGEAMVY
jgi:hypothetical protein